MSEQFALDAYAARSCPVKTQNAFDPRVRMPPADEDLREKFSGGQEYEARVLDSFLAEFRGSVLDMRSHHGESWEARERLCLQAMDSGVDAIIHGVLPQDFVGHRAGKADIWLRGEHVDDMTSPRHGLPGYHPVEVKSHLIQEKRQGHGVRLSTLARPFLADAVVTPDVGIRYTSREQDLLQMAHYWRHLQALGLVAGGDPYAAVIGKDGHDATTGPVLTWIPLTERHIRTFSRSSSDGWRLRAPLERYDHEHGFRVRVARHAMAQDGTEAAPPLMVRPIKMRECDWCPWWEVCRPALGEDDLSVRIDKTPLDVREISVLRSLGISTVTDLATADVEALLPRYVPETSHRHGSEQRLRIAAHRARMLADGVELERTSTGALHLPRADVEIDFDIETTATDRVYLWGFLRTDRVADTQEYVSFSAFTELDDHGEAELAEQAMGWLREQFVEHPDALVYHYSDYETVRIHRLLLASGGQHLAWVDERTATSFVDLFAIVRGHFFGTHGLGLKQVASAAADFHWRDDDPGGLNSQSWFDEAVHAKDAAERDSARVRVLEYNEDDVLATWHLRAWLDSLD